MAISPYEMFEFIFAAVEEELGADPSYLIAIIVEFLHWYDIQDLFVI